MKRIALLAAAVAGVSIGGCHREPAAYVAASVGSSAVATYDRMGDRTDIAANLTVIADGEASAMLIGTYTNGQASQPYPMPDGPHKIIGTPAIGHGGMNILAQMNGRSDIRFTADDLGAYWAIDTDQIRTLAAARSVEWRTDTASGTIPPHALLAIREYLAMFE